MVNEDGSGPHRLVARGTAAVWSPDGRWLYYQNGSCIEKVPVDGGAVTRVRCETYSTTMGISTTDGTLYYLNTYYGDEDLRKARPETGLSQQVARIPALRIPVDPTLWQAVLSPDDQWLAAPLSDRGTANL